MKRTVLGRGDFLPEMEEWQVIYSMQGPLEATLQCKLAVAIPILFDLFVGLLS